MITGHWYIVLVLLLIVLIFYGPGKLPEIGGAVGKGIREFRKSVDSVSNKGPEEVGARKGPEDVGARATADDGKGPANGEGVATTEAAPSAETPKEHSSLLS
jgi:sec-independent protein translocase protein TatA